MKKVTVYSTSTCPYCTMVKDYLKDKKIEYVEKNVAEDNDAAQEMVKLTQQMGVPVTVIENEFVIGCNTAKIDELIG